MRIFLPLAVLFSISLHHISAAAEEITQYEIQLAPSLGYSNFEGLNLGLDLKFGFALDNHWQMVIGGYSGNSRHGRTYVGNLGLQYNFSEEWSRSFYLAGGVGYGDIRYAKDGQGISRYDKGAYGFLNFGKRVALNDSGTIAWRPEIGIEAGNFGDHDGNLTITPLNFSYSF